MIKFPLTYMGNIIEPVERFWVALFSKTGSEILNVSQLLGRFPDLVITNQVNTTGINPDLLKECEICHIPEKPTAEDYRRNIPYGAIVTLHGFLRIIPSEICDEYEIYNGHPGDIIAYPELKGFNPQEKAVRLNLPSTGCVIHEVTSGVDEGPILARSKVSIEKIKEALTEVKRYHNLEDETKALTITLTYVLHAASIDLWVAFLLGKLVTFAPHVQPPTI